MEIMGWAPGYVGRVVLNLPSTELVTILVGSIWINDFCLFGPLLKHLAGKQFASDADRKQAFTTHYRQSDTDLTYAGIQALVLPWDGVDDDYVWRSDVYHLQAICHIYIKVWIKFPRLEYMLPYLLWLVRYQSYNLWCLGWYQNIFLQDSHAWPDLPTFTLIMLLF
jgi:hypothetical protein